MVSLVFLPFCFFGEGHANSSSSSEESHQPHVAGLFLLMGRPFDVSTSVARSSVLARFPLLLILPELWCKQSSDTKFYTGDWSRCNLAPPIPGLILQSFYQINMVAICASECIVNPRLGYNHHFIQFCELHQCIHF